MTEEQENNTAQFKEIKKFIFEDLIDLAEKSEKNGCYTFLMNRWNSVMIDGQEYALKLEKR